MPFQIDESHINMVTKARSIVHLDNKTIAKKEAKIASAEITISALEKEKAQLGDNLTQFENDRNKIINMYGLDITDEYMQFLRKMQKLNQANIEYLKLEWENFKNEGNKIKAQYGEASGQYKRWLKEDEEEFSKNLLKINNFSLWDKKQKELEQEGEEIKKAHGSTSEQYKNWIENRRPDLEELKKIDTLKLQGEIKEKELNTGKANLRSRKIMLEAEKDSIKAQPGNTSKKHADWSEKYKKWSEQNDEWPKKNQEFLKEFLENFSNRETLEKLSPGDAYLQMQLLIAQRIKLIEKQIHLKNREITPEAAPVLLEKNFREAVILEVQERIKKLQEYSKDNEKENMTHDAIVNGTLHIMNILESKSTKQSEIDCKKHKWTLHGRKMKTPKGCKITGEKFQEVVWETYQDVMVNGTRLHQFNTIGKEMFDPQKNEITSEGLSPFDGFGDKVGIIFGITAIQSRTRSNASAAMTKGPEPFTPSYKKTNHHKQPHAPDTTKPPLKNL